MCVKASGVIGEGSDNCLIVEEFKAKKRGICCAVYGKLLKLKRGRSRSSFFICSRVKL